MEMNRIQVKEAGALRNSRKVSMVVKSNYIKSNQVKKALSDLILLQAGPEVSFNPYLLVPWQEHYCYVGGGKDPKIRPHFSV